MAYLTQGIGEYYIVGETGRAYYVSSDGTVITTQVDNNEPGVYSVASGDIVRDEQIIKAISSFYQKKVQNNTKTLSEFVEYTISKATQNTNQFLPITKIPKFTKGLATALHSASECITFIETDDSIEFLCFGYRPKIAEFIESTNAAVYVMPERFYRGVMFETRFSPTGMVGKILRGSMGIVVANGPKLEKLSLIMGVNRINHSNFIENNILSSGENDE